MKFANFSQSTVLTRSEDINDPKSVIRLVDEVNSPDVDVMFVLDSSTRSLLVKADTNVQPTDNVLDFPQYAGDGGELIWVLVPEIGLVNRRTVSMSVMEFGDYFLVALQRGALPIRVGVGTEPVLLTVGGVSDFDMNSDVSWFTPKTLPCAPYLRKGSHGLFNVRYKFIDYGHTDVKVLRWDGYSNIQYIIDPSFYEAIRLERERSEREALEMKQSAKELEERLHTQQRLIQNLAELGFAL